MLFFVCLICTRFSYVPGFILFVTPYYHSMYQVCLWFCICLWRLFRPGVLVFLLGRGVEGRRGRNRLSRGASTGPHCCVLLYTFFHNS